MKHHFWPCARAVSLATRLSIIIFWLMIFFAFLFIPSISSVWSSGREINIFSWTELIDSQKITEFERSTGIKVNIGFYESNEELFAKLYMTKGKGYDLIFPTDYMVQTLIKQRMLQKIDHSKLDFLSRLNTQFMNLYFDPAGDYSVPYLWSLYGIGVNKAFFKKPLARSWALLFDSTITKQPRVMAEEARELMLIGAWYLYGSKPRF